jgi:hypothetical protein
MGFFTRFFQQNVPSRSESSRAHAVARVAWWEGTTMPIPDWTETAKSRPANADVPTLDAFWLDAARQWLDRLKTHLDGDYAIDASPHFLLLSTLGRTLAPLTLEVCERSRKRIFRTLANIADQRGRGPHVVLVFATEDEYYAYVDHYYTAPGTYAMSSGMFLRKGYGHFVFPSTDPSQIEPTIGHELTHCLLSHLPLPLWLDEGMAVTMEKHLNPTHDNPRYALYSPREMIERRAKFWNADTIQEFWSGRSYSRPDEGSALSYDLGERLVRLISREYSAFTAFANAAKFRDAGANAAIEKLGLRLEDCVTAVLGDGDWRPDPSRWTSESESS